MTWQRDTDAAPFPTVWRKFQKCAKDSDKIYNFQIQDATEDMTEDVLNLMLKNYVNEEPVAACFDFLNNAESLQYIKLFYTTIMKKQAALVCFEIQEDGKLKLAGCNMTYVVEPNDDFSAFAKTKTVEEYAQVYYYVNKKGDIYNKLNVKHCLKAGGLCVDSNYRGLGLAVEILKERETLCKALKIPVSAADFSSAGGQAAARKAGYELLVEVKYVDIMNELSISQLTNITHPVMQLMYKKINID